MENSGILLPNTEKVGPKGPTGVLRQAKLAGSVLPARLAGRGGSGCSQRPAGEPCSAAARGSAGVAGLGHSPEGKRCSHVWGLGSLSWGGLGGEWC